MALSRASQAHVQSHVAAGNPMSLATGSFTPPNSSLLVAIVGIENIGTHSNGAVSGGGWTWTKQLASTAQYLGGTPPNYYGVLEIWTAPVTTGASMTVTATSGENSGSDPGAITIHVVSYTGYNTSTPTGATASDITAGDAGLTITLSGAPASTSEIVAARWRIDDNTANSTATPDAAFTEIYEDDTLSGYGDLESMARGGSTSTSVIWTDTSDNAAASTWARHSFALEILSAGGSSNFNKTVIASCTSTSSILKTIGKVLPATITSTSSILKIVGKPLLATCTTSIVVGTAVKVILKMLVATCTSTASLLKCVGKPLLATCTSTAALIRTVGTHLLATCTSTASLIRSTAKTLLATCTTSVVGTAIKVILKTLIATCTSTSTLIRRVGKPLATTCTSTASMLKSVSPHFLVTCTSTATLITHSAFLRTLAATCTTTTSLLKSVGKILLATCTSTANTVAHKCILYMQSVIATCTTSGIFSSIKSALADVASLAAKLRPYKPLPPPVIPGSDTLYLLNELQKVSNAFNAHVEATKNLEARLKAAGF